MLRTVASVIGNGVIRRCSHHDVYHSVWHKLKIARRMMDDIYMKVDSPTIMDNIDAARNTKFTDANAELYAIRKILHRYYVDFQPKGWKKHIDIHYHFQTKLINEKRYKLQNIIKEASILLTYEQDLEHKERLEKVIIENAQKLGHLDTLLREPQRVLDYKDTECT